MPTYIANMTRGWLQGRPALFPGPQRFTLLNETAWCVRGPPTSGQQHQQSCPG